MNESSTQSVSYCKEALCLFNERCAAAAAGQLRQVRSGKGKTNFSNQLNSHVVGQQ